jgi:tetratricopeptide (TPR) repeat protein
MFRMVRKFFLALLVAASAFPGDYAIAAPGGQRRPAPPRPQSGISGLDALGLSQPESVRAILLLYSGKAVSKAKAEEMETELKKNPDKIDPRLVLIGYYSANGRTAADRSRLRQHVLWMVENHPEHPATAEPSLRDLPDDRDGNAQILALWMKNLELHGDDVAVLKDAEKFFFGRDPAEADHLIHQISVKEPNNKEWPTELAQLYRMFGIPDQQIDDPVQRALEAYRRVLELTRNATARETLAGDMAQDAFKVGDFDGSQALAKVHLQSQDHSATQRANTILGRIALREGNLAAADQYLLASAGPTAAKDIAISGPTLILAKELLEHGERDSVLQYLENCLTLWPRGQNALEIWIADIQRGKAPNFGNLQYGLTQ